MDDQEHLLKKTKILLQKAHQYYHLCPSPQTWQEFHQALKQYSQALEDRETQKALQYHERLQRLGKKTKNPFS